LERTRTAFAEGTGAQYNSIWHRNVIDPKTKAIQWCTKSGSRATTLEEDGDILFTGPADASNA
jgi:hypothetical protein